MERKTKQHYRERLLSQDEDSFDDQDLQIETQIPQKQSTPYDRYESHDNFRFRPRFSTITSDLSENSKIYKGFKGKRPLEDANCCQRFWFIWVIPVLRIANLDKKLTTEVLGELGDNDCAYTQTRRLERVWNRYKNSKAHHKLCRTIARTFISEYVIASFMGLILSFGEMAAPIFLYYILSFLQNPDDQDFTRGYLLAGGLMITQFITFMLSQHTQVFNQFLGRKTTMGLVGLITEKTLRVTPSAEKTFSQGEIINRVQTDATKLAILSENFQYILRLPVQLVLCIILLFYMIGVSFLGGLGIILLVTIYNIILSKLSFGYQKKILKAQDERMNVTTQALQNIKTIKFNAWEEHFEAKIQEKREKQLDFIKKRLILTTLNISSFYIMPMIVCFVAFAIFIGTGHTLSPSLTYSVILLFNILKDPLKFMPIMVNIFLEAFMSVKRIEEYLHQEEVDPNLIDQLPFDPFNLAVDIQNASLSWKMPTPHSKEENEADSSSNKK